MEKLSTAPENVKSTQASSYSCERATPSRNQFDFWGQKLGSAVIPISRTHQGVTFSVGSDAFYDWTKYERYAVFLPWLKRAIDINQFRTLDVLEIGFGLGVDLHSFARRGARVYGVDTSNRLVRLCSEAFARYRSFGQSNGGGRFEASF